MEDRNISCENCRKLAVCKVREHFNSCINANIFYVSDEIYVIYKILGSSCKQYEVIDHEKK